VDEPQQGGAALADAGEMTARPQTTSVITSQDVGVRAGTESRKANQFVDCGANTALRFRPVVDRRMQRRFGQQPGRCRLPFLRQRFADGTQVRDVFFSRDILDDVRLTLLPEHSPKPPNRRTNGSQILEQLFTRKPLARGGPSDGHIDKSYWHVDERQQQV